MTRRRALLLLIAGGAVLGIAAEAAAYELDQPGRWVPDLLTGWTLLGCGVGVWWHRPDSRSGPLLALTGVTWFVGNFEGALVYVHRGPLVHLLLAHGPARPPRPLLAAGYAIAVIPDVWASEPVAIALPVLLAAAALAVHRPASGRAQAAALRAVVLVAVVLIVGAIARLVVEHGAETPSLLAYEIALCGVGGLLTANALGRSGEQAELADLVVELGGGRPETLQDVVARALGDPSVQVGFRLPDTDAFVDGSGRPLQLPDPRSGRAVTLLRERDEPVAALVHDPAAVRDVALLDALGTATALSARHAHLQAALRARLDELAASTRRLVEAAEVERARLEQLLHDGAEQRLLAIAWRLETVEAEAAGGAREQLAAAFDDLHELARGLHPRGLTEKGLAGAVAELAARSPVAVTAEVAVTTPLPQAVEAAAYFVCAEALANVAKYAAASGAAIVIREEGGWLSVRVCDDGVGDADPAGGSGLRGLSDRVTALGGSLEVESPPGAGTRIAVRMPLSGSS